MSADLEIDERPALEITLGDEGKPNVRKLDEDDRDLQVSVKRGSDSATTEGAEELRQQLETERRARQEAEARRAEAESGRELDRFHMGRRQMLSDHSEVTAALESMKTKREAAEQRYAEALEQGDFTVAAKIQTEMAQLAVDEREAERFKVKVERAIEQAKKQPPPQPKPADGLEEALSQMTKPTADWLRKHPDYVTDQRKNARAMAAHHTAMAEGIAPDTPEYFSFIEEKLGLREEKQQERTRDDRGRFTEREAAVAAPVTNRASTSSTDLPSRRTVTLTRSEVEFCELNDIEPEEYAKNKMQLAAEGRLGPQGR